MPGFRAVIATALAVPAAALLAYAAWYDVALRAVPNWLAFGVLLLGLIIRAADASLPAGLAFGALTFAVLVTVWLGGGVGGGDVKLWAASALLMPPRWQPELAFSLRVIVIGGLLALIYLALYLVVRRPLASRAGGKTRRIFRIEAWRISRHAPLPYAFAIAGSVLTLLPLFHR